MRAPPAKRRLPDFVLTIAVFTFTGPLVGGLLFWIVWFAGVLWNRDAWSSVIRTIEPFSTEALMLLGAALLLAYVSAGGVAFSVGVLVALARQIGWTSVWTALGAVVALHCCIFMLSFLEGVRGIYIERLPYFPAAAGAHYLFPVSLFATFVCWIVLQRLARRS